jgi:hypothetical protein
VWNTRERVSVAVEGRREEGRVEQVNGDERRNEEKWNGRSNAESGKKKGVTRQV